MIIYKLIKSQINLHHAKFIFSYTEDIPRIQITDYNC